MTAFKRKKLWKCFAALSWLALCLYYGIAYESSGRGDGGVKTSFLLGAKAEEVRLPGLKADKLYGVTISLKSLASLGEKTEIRAGISDARGLVVEKILHAGDADFYATIRPRSDGDGRVLLNKHDANADVKLPLLVECRPIALAGNSNVFIAAQPNSTWQDAQPFELGQTIFGSADERPYIPAPSEDTYQALLKGFQWFKFTYKGSEPKLVFFVLDMLDRDVPVDVDIFTLGKDEKTGQEDVVPYTEGGFIYKPEATQNFPGLYKFRTRIVKPGQTYYVRVAANHPAYQLRTYLYPVPPYKDPRQAVRTGMDFLINVGDTWHSNTPRRGTVALRNTMPHAETQLCIACHPTQFTTRGYLIAVKNGYPVTMRPELKFLTERIYNNPRPLYGAEGANWVRVIYSARTVASRLPYLMSLFEEYVSGEPTRPGFDVGYGKYLKIHYAGLEKLPGMEADGCSPSVSPFEIAAQSWQTYDLLYRRTGDPEWLQERNRVEKMIPEAPVENIIDLNWKIAALAIIDRTKYKAEIDKLIDQLYRWQRENGQWPYKFEPDGKPSDFITFHALWALALAGRRPEADPKMAKTYQYCLGAQRPEGGWQGDPVYKGFNTPFRDTQFAVMALSELYRGPGGKGWGAAFPEPPKEVHPEFLDKFLSQADQYWDKIDEEVLAAIRKVLAEGDQVLAREAAAEALGRVADPGAIGVLARALGDPSKLVQRAAAWALREIAVRRGAGRAEIAQALSSDNDRVRWGATRLFDQHFRDLTGDDALLSALIKRLDDPVPMVRFQAASGLWRWWYWQVDRPERRERILTSLCERMGKETHPWVRRGLIESVYNVLDENTGYFQAWVRAATREEDKKRINDGYEAVVRHQAQILARALKSGSRLARDGILTALWDFHIRHMAIPDTKTLKVNLPAVFTQYIAGVPDLHRPGYEYPPYREAAQFRYDVRNKFQQTRIGNDSELIHFFASSGPELEEALLACLKGADTPMKLNVLKAGSTLSEAGGPKFALAVLKLSMDPDPEVRQTVRYVYENNALGALNIASNELDRELVETVVRILSGNHMDGQAIVLPLLADIEPDSPWARDPRIIEAVKSAIKAEPRSPLYAHALAAAAAFEPLLSDADVQERIVRAVKDSDSEVRKTAVRIVVNRLSARKEFEPLVKRALANMDSGGRKLLLQELGIRRNPYARRGRSSAAIGLDSAGYLGGDRYEDDPLDRPLIFAALVESLSDQDVDVRSAALDLISRRSGRKGLQVKADLRRALVKLKDDPNLRVRQLASSLLAGKDFQEALANRDPASLLDYKFFVERVQPILAKPGADGKSCAICHASHAIFRIVPPDETGRFSDEASRENYKSALRVVNVAEPEKSLILIKPTRPTDSAAGVDVNVYEATHNGGQRWVGNESSWEYQTILQWIRGARAE